MRNDAVEFLHIFAGLAREFFGGWGGRVVLDRAELACPLIAGATSLRVVENGRIEEPFACKRTSFRWRAACGPKPQLHPASVPTADSIPAF